MKTARFIFNIIKTSLASAFALRSTFLLQAILMLLNNLAFFAVWWVFFQRFSDINGWQFADMQALFGITAFAFGLTILLAGGVLKLAITINEGILDAYLVQPQNPLMHCCLSESRASGCGDMIAGVILLAFSGHATVSNMLPIIVLIITAACTLLAFMIAIQCLAFWLGNMDSFARQISEFILTFSSYPLTIYEIGFKILLFTIIPAAFVSHLPVMFLREGDWRFLFICLIAGPGYLILAWRWFQFGLKRYESGNRFMLRS